MQKLDEIINMKANPVNDSAFIAQCKSTLETYGALVLSNFLLPQALNSIKQEGIEHQHRAYYAATQHNVYLTKTDVDFAVDHPRNRLVTSSKGCITDEEIPADSALRTLYTAADFQDFLCAVLNEEQLYPYADSLSSINLHYASHGQELGWHFDNSSFAITLLVQKPQAGGVFEYIEEMRDADQGEMNYAGVEKLLNQQITPKTLQIEPGDLVLFRGRNAIHRVTPTQGDITRMLVVLAYNAQPDISLSETARMTFYGRI
ncbi:ArpA protein-Streptomyces griseus [Yersinia frederiksenii]|uniref:ArpA protein-Streptomyces griseus n=2 Tax=Yersinia frederiksenii TaxID=29484 RepID=A0A380PPB4_YERFR|nr:2OG-Fe(II) oxygenase [Yersinia frederiksenii]ATM95891.1 arpA protein [Yersinia frederiksenii]EEQ13224.1 Oxidoreductase, 2OG-Fe(II) oxygenase family [Yersinia frederiksenii ATCC 33641]KGA44341.1 2OG-Fe(II) oxygenase superfamily protein [Yersinia frederiksenii ATCC 33641]SUP75455.1 ArpA protein-Streptomyces griseus [Yersinia frederiksenii]